MCLSQGGNPRFMSYLPKSTGIKEGSVLSLAVSVEGGGGGGGGWGGRADNGGAVKVRQTLPSIHCSVLQTRQ